MPEVPPEFQWRLDRARTEISDAGCDLMILDSGEALSWISGYTISETMYRAVFVPREGMPWFVLRELDADPCREGGWIDDVVGYVDTDRPEDVMAQELVRRGFAEARIAVDFSSVGCNLARMDALRAALPAAGFVDLRGITDSLRWIKSEHEIGLLAQAARIADTALAELAAAVRPGLTTREAAALAAAHFLRNGADTGETGPIILGKGNHEFLHGMFRTDTLALGDIMHVELIPYVSRYGARIMRPIIVGQPTPRQRDVANILVALQDEQIAAMKPGAIAADVDRIVREGVLQAGLRDEYMNVTAYTLGLYTRTPRTSDFSRVFLPDQKWPLEENIVFHVYTTAEGLGFSETVVVTPEGGRRLTQTPRTILGSAAAD